MSGDGKIILIVDDEPSNIDLLKGLLSGAYKMKAATGGVKALEIAAREPRPDLILLDVMMPGMDGYEVFRHLRSNPATADIPVIFLSGHDDEAERQTGMALGAADFLSKPAEPARLDSAIRKVL